VAQEFAMPSPSNFFSRLHWLILQIVLIALTLIAGAKLIALELKSLF